MSGTEHGDERPEPWWSRPAYEDRAPSSDGDRQGDDGAQGAFEAPRGAPAYSADADLQPRYDQPVPTGTGWDAREPEGRPLGDAPHRQRGAAWGYPTEVFAAPAGQGGGRRRGRAGVVAGIVALALVGGGIGGATVQALRGGSSLDPSASLGTGVSNGKIERDPNSVPGIANRVLRSTVSIEVLQSNGTGGSGSGVVLRADGFILTNNHVVQAGANGAQISVIVNGSGGRSLPAQIIGLDPETDLAVIKVDATLEPATLGRSADLAIGDPVIAIGSPLGLNGTVTTGIVSALNRTVNVPGTGGRRATPLLNAIQTDAAINPGNSGGALVDRFGAVIGINSAIATLGTGSGGESGSIGVGFAIPVDFARSVAEELIRKGKATHPAIGVEAGNQVSPDGTKQGARLSRIVAGGPASATGLQVGDVVDRVGTTKVGSVDELILALRESRVGDTVELGYLRDGLQRTTKVVLGDKTGN